MGHCRPLTPEYSDFMAPAVQPPPIDLVHTYRMVSQKYLDLTRQKLELVRLPQAPRNASRTLGIGVSKNELEPVIDHWLEAYNWRKQEDFYNDRLPQFRVPINGTRLHFVHERSRMPAALPLLFIHGFPESFIAISKMIDLLSDPMSSPSEQGTNGLTAFHVVAPSMPGMGFSDPISEQSNNIQATCDILDALMTGLGYNQYIIHGSGWGFNVARAIALTHSESCMAIHTVNPDVPLPRFVASQPRFVASPSVWLKARIVNLTTALPRRLGFGVDNMGTLSSMPTEMGQQYLQPSAAGVTPPVTPDVPPAASERPQTAAYALCDSPSGLLAYVYDAIRPQTDTNIQSPGASLSPEIQHAQSPFSPASYTNSYAASTPASRSGRSTASSSPVATRRPSIANRSPPKMISQNSSSSNPGAMGPWNPTAIVDWTMIHWLPGPEVALRWLANSTVLMPTYWASYSMVPLGISHFRDPAPSGSGTGKVPPQWVEAYHRVAMVKRREGRVRFPAWEVPVEIVLDLREFVGLLGIFAAQPMPPQ